MTPQDEEEVARHTKPFVEHLEDLRVTILRCLVALVAGMILVVPFSPAILRLLKLPLAKAGQNPEEFLRVFRVVGGMSITMRIALWGGLVLSIPFLGYFISAFIFPGLTKRERKSVLRASGFAAVLFVAGVALGYFATLPVALSLMLRIIEWLGSPCEFLELSDYVGFVLKLLVAFGLAFELPVVVLALGSMGLISSEQLRKKRPYVIVGLFVVAMVLTPPDPLTQLMMALPLTALYECCIWVIRLKEIRAERAERGR